MKQKRIAHITEDGKEESVLEHLRKVGMQMRAFTASYSFGEIDMEPYAFMTGLGHDIGKYSDLFQQKISGNANIKVDHSTAGAKEMYKRGMLAAAFAIAGHHGGLPNGKDATDSCLTARKSREIEDYSAYAEELVLERVADVKKISAQGKFSYAFFVRMLFSALVDADFLQTERFMADGRVCRGDYDTIDVLYERMSAFIAEKGWLDGIGEKQGINKIRAEILAGCQAKGSSDAGVFSLTVPTGGGKTVASMLFALEHAKKHGKERVIYVIPYTSIIEQNAAVYKAILGEKNVLEHYANVSVERDGDENDEGKRRQFLSMENWDAPVIVTTSVQFFESLFSHRVSKCRKLHHIANSVVVFDEVQMIPLFYTKPCMYAIKELVSSYAVTAVLCTATQPDFGKWLAPLEVTELCQEYQRYFMLLKRTVVKDIGKMTKDFLTDEINKRNQVLVIVNKKKTAQEIFGGLEKEGSYHLSTYMTPEHRKEVIAEIKERLKKAKEDSGIRVRVVSTSLIEAGVDVDFPSVYREKAGIDSIIQSAGRCNREGDNKAEDSVVSVFELEGESVPHLIEKNVAVTEETAEKCGCYDSTEAISQYFHTLHHLDEAALDAHGVVDAFVRPVNGEEFPFRTVGRKFRLIEQNTKLLIVPRRKETRELVDELHRRIQTGESFKTILRKLGSSTLNLYEWDYNRLIEESQAYEELEGVAVLQNMASYREDIGLYVEGFLCM